jgi:hypothetical protein
MQRSLLTLFLIATIPALATAQATPTTQPQPQPQNTPPHRSITDWPNPHFHYGRHLDIVTLAAPTIRQSCQIRKLTADTVTCVAPFYRAKTVFQRADILAAIQPPSFDNFFGGLTAAAIIPLAILSWVLLPYGGVLALCLIGPGILALYSKIAYHDPSDNLHDILLYQRPNSTLTVHLH